MNGYEWYVGECKDNEYDVKMNAKKKMNININVNISRYYLMINHIQSNDNIY